MYLDVPRYGVSINGGTRITGWFVMAIPMKMDNLGTPISGNLYVYSYIMIYLCVCALHLSIY